MIKLNDKIRYYPSVTNFRYFYKTPVMEGMSFSGEITFIEIDGFVNVSITVSDNLQINFKRVPAYAEMPANTVGYGFAVIDNDE